MISSLFVFILITLTVLSNNDQKKLKKKKRPCGLLITRVSTAEQKKGTSLEKQSEWGKFASKNMKVPLIKTIEDDISGEIFIEKYFDEIMDTVKKHNVTHVYVYSFDRLSRSFFLGVKMVHYLWKYDVTIVTRSFIPDPSKHDHRIRVYMELLFAEMEHGGISERTRLGIIQKLKKKKKRLIFLKEFPYP